jgi:hypothetical protein
MDMLTLMMHSQPIPRNGPIPMVMDTGTKALEQTQMLAQLFLEHLPPTDLVVPIPIPMAHQTRI